MKSILQSIKPQYCELIASGKKTIEVRKTRPKCELPVKGYIYCTKAKKLFWHNGLCHSLDDLYRMPSGEIKYGYSGELMCCNEPYTADNFLNGKVIGEYVCDDIVELEYDELEECYMFKDCYGGYILDEVLSNSCLSYDEICKYGKGKPLYAWHISDLKIYDKPKELSEFYKECTDKVEICKHCKWMDESPNKGCDGLKPLTRPPQSWCYVEEVTE